MKTYSRGNPKLQYTYLGRRIKTRQAKLRLSSVYDYTPEQIVRLERAGFRWCSGCKRFQEATEFTKGQTKCKTYYRDYLYVKRKRNRAVTENDIV